jgi:hypothetical protein
MKKRNKKYNKIESARKVNAKILDHYTLNFYAVDEK